MDVKAFLDTLPIMANGMLGIFFVTGVIIVTTMILNVCTKKREDHKQ